MIPAGNRIGNRNESYGGIIHAEGVRGDFLSSAPKARRAALGCVGAAGGLPCCGEAFDLLAQMLEIARTDAEAEHFLDHGDEVCQGADRAEAR